MSRGVAPHEPVPPLPVQRAANLIPQLKSGSIDLVGDLAIELSDIDDIVDLVPPPDPSSVSRLPSTLWVEDRLIQNDVFIILN
jgi:hypothetical protein